MSKISSDINSERDLWAAMITLKVKDAIYPFLIPNRDKSGYTPNLDLQLERLKNKQKIIFDSERSVHQDKALYFLERSSFDTAAELAGYDTMFINKVFEFVQRALILKKELKL